MIYAPITGVMMLSIAILAIMFGAVSLALGVKVAQSMNGGSPVLFLLRRPWFGKSFVGEAAGISRQGDPLPSGVKSPGVYVPPLKEGFSALSGFSHGYPAPSSPSPPTRALCLTSTLPYTVIYGIPHKVSVHSQKPARAQDAAAVPNSSHNSSHGNEVTGDPPVFLGALWNSDNLCEGGDTDPRDTGEDPVTGGKGGKTMAEIMQVPDQVVTIKAERVIGHGTKQVLIEESKVLPAVKIVEIIPSIAGVRMIVKTGKVIVQGTVHKQIFYIGTDGLEHHVAEDLSFSELVDMVPVDPAIPVTEGMNPHDMSSVENLVFEFDPTTGLLTQKIILRLDTKVTQTQQIPVAIDPYGTLIKAQVLVGEASKQKFIEERKTLAATKIVEVVPRLVNVRTIPKAGKVIVQGTVHKQIFYVGTDDLIHHISEDLPFSELVEVPPVNPALPVAEGMNVQDHSVVENLVFEFDPATGELTQKIILLLSVKVTQTQQIPVALDPAGTLIYTDLVIGHATKQKLIEETKTLAAVKVIDVVPRIAEISSIVKNGKVIVQGTLHKQIFYVGTDDLVHHEAEDIPFSEMVEVPPVNPERPVVEGMDQQDHSVVENLVWEFDPATGTFVEKVVILLDVKVTEKAQITVATPAVIA